MGARFLVENFFDTTMFPAHTVTGQDEASTHEGFRVGNARRQTYDYYTPITANAQRYVEAACDRVRKADMLVLDRGHNLGGETVRLWVSNQSDFSTYTEVFAVTIPTQVFTNVTLDAGRPVLTEEGAVVIYFGARLGRYWRVVVDAMGAGLRPQIVGAFLGLSWSEEPLLPWDDEPRELAFTEVVSPDLWAASTRKAKRRNTTGTPVIMKLANDARYDVIRYHVHSLFWEGFVMWYVPMEEQVERAWLSYAPAGTYSAPLTDRPARDLVLVLVEHEPKQR